MNNIKQFEQVIEYIEAHLHENIETEALAKMLRLSTYEFRRIFSFLAGVPIGEYLRKRRLSVAARELMLEKCSISEAASKWGYDSPSSFSRAFKSFHGCAPTEIHGNEIKMFTGINIYVGISGGNDLTYELRRLPAFSVSGISDISDDSDTECCEAVWEKFYETSHIPGDDKKIYAVYRNFENGVKCTIGTKSESGEECVSAALWACFKVKGSADSVVNGIYSRILGEWLKSSNIRLRKDMPNVEIFPEDMDSDDFEWEILVPVDEGE